MMNYKGYVGQVTFKKYQLEEMIANINEGNIHQEIFVREKK
jgi:hypothetical protein